MLSWASFWPEWGQINTELEGRAQSWAAAYELPLVMLILDSDLIPGELLSFSSIFVSPREWKV